MSPRHRTFQDSGPWEAPVLSITASISRWISPTWAVATMVKVAELKLGGGKSEFAFATIVLIGVQPG